MIKPGCSEDGMPLPGQWIEAAIGRLNPEQRTAVDLCDGSILVMAPVGTGKTDVITLRAVRAVERGTEPAAMLCLSFTNKAAKEMKTRLRHFLGRQATEISARTFHALCAGILRMEAQTLGLDGDFVIYDEEDCRELLGAIWRSFGIQVPREEVDRFEFLLFEAAGRARLRKYGEDAAQKPDDIFRTMLETSSLRSLNRSQNFRFVAILHEYVAVLRDNHALDFSDLILGVNILWDEHPAALARWQEKYRWIQVDEVQDTSRPEYRILSRLAAAHRNLSFFGDIDQTIYEWRGSAPVELLDRYRREFGPVTEIHFVRNYRSTRNILDACAAVLRGCPDAVTHEILPQMAESGEKVRIHEALRLSSEADWIADRIREIKEAEALSYRDFAVLTRTNFTARRLSSAFESIGLPHVKVEEFKFFQRAEIKNTLAHLRLLVNRHDAGSAARFLQSPPKGIGPATVAELRAEPRAAGLKLGDMLDAGALEAGDPFAALLEAYAAGNLVVFDVETTGLDTAHDEIVQLAAARCGAGGISEKFHAWLRPSRSVGSSFEVHRISDDFLAQNGREPGEVFEEFRGFCGSATLAGHNLAAFDLPILVSQMRRLQLPDPAIAATYDTLDLTRRFHKLPRYTLGHIAKALALPTTPTHSAEADVATTVELAGLLCREAQECAAVRREAIRKHGAKFLPWARKLGAWKLRAQRERPAALLLHVLEDAGLAAFFEGQDGGARRVEHLKTLVRLFEMHDDPALEPEEALLSLLNLASLGTDLDRHLNDEDAVLLLTAHQAKGLEFNTVFIADATDSEFPSWRSRREGRTNEEHRLFYVAMSRAKRRLFLSYPALDSYGRETLPSRYIGMIPGDVSERV